MTDKLYCVTVTYSGFAEVVVLATSVKEAQEVALDSADDHGLQYNAQAVEVTDVKQLHSDWRDTYPYGAETEDSCRTLLRRWAEQRKPPAPPDPRQLDILEGKE